MWTPSHVDDVQTQLEAELVQLGGELDQCSTFEMGWPTQVFVDCFGTLPHEHDIQALRRRSGFHSWQDNDQNMQFAEGQLETDTFVQLMTFDPATRSKSLPKNTLFLSRRYTAWRGP